MQNLAWIDGKVCDLAEARVPLEDRGYFFGDGVYEVIKIYNGVPFYLAAHLERLHRSAAAISIDLPYSSNDIEKIVKELIKKSGRTEGYIYMQLTRGHAERDHLFPDNASPSLIIFIRGLPTAAAPGSVSCIILPDERWLNCHIKTVNLLPNVLARQKAAEAGAAEAILYRPEGIVTEGSRSNVFAVIEGNVRTHPESNLILSGITRRIVLDILAELEIPCFEEAFTLNELKKATEVWIASSMAEVKPVILIDGAPVNGSALGTIYQRLAEEFQKKIEAFCYA
ncbi:MAG TPA: D-amino-acid transaminase [Candidatus Limnocylindrales bacterium]|nr:D-amino-acid transaminase [Candidatus Limnocylindrales bacterium]